ncbi:MAG: dihydropteroate synthase, partial [Actinomycetes bacterium]
MILGRRVFDDNQWLMMAIINRTPDSFYDKGISYATSAAHERVAQVVDAGADIVDIGGVKAGPGAVVSVDEEIRRTGDFVGQVRAAHPDVIISVDTWRSTVGRVALTEGADVINDAWGGWDPELAAVAGEFGAGLVCTHTGGAKPRTRPHRVSYQNLVDDVVRSLTDLADRAVSLGVPTESIMIDPGHDFGKNTYHSLEITRELGRLVDTGWPVLVSLSNKDFVGETLDRPVGERLIGTLAATAVCAWLGAR